VVDTGDVLVVPDDDGGADGVQRNEGSSSVRSSRADRVLGRRRGADGAALRIGGFGRRWRGHLATILNKRIA
jgi:hypothetical protein